MSLPSMFQPAQQVSPQARLQEAIAPYFVEFDPTPAQLEHLTTKIIDNYDYLLRHSPFAPNRFEPKDRFDTRWILRDFVYILVSHDQVGFSAEAYDLLVICNQRVRAFRVSLQSRFGHYPGRPYGELFRILISFGFIVEASPIRKLERGMSQARLRLMLAQRGLSKTGSASDLANRLVPHIPESELNSLTKDILLFEVTEAGKLALETLPVYLERFRVALGEAVRGIRDSITAYRNALDDEWLQSITADGMMARLATIKAGGLTELIAPHFAVFALSAEQLRRAADVLYQHYDFAEGPFRLNDEIIWELANIIASTGVPNLRGDAYQFLKKYQRMQRFDYSLEDQFWYSPRRTYRELIVLLLSYNLIRIERNTPTWGNKDVQVERWATESPSAEQELQDWDASKVLLKTTEAGDRLINNLWSCFEQVREVITPLLETWSNEAKAYRRLRTLAPPERPPGKHEITLEVHLTPNIIERILEGIETNRAGWIMVGLPDRRGAESQVVVSLCPLKDPYSFQTLWEVSVWALSTDKNGRSMLATLGFDVTAEDLDYPDADYDESDAWEIPKQVCRNEVTDTVLTVLDKVFGFGVGRLVRMTYAPVG